MTAPITEGGLPALPLQLLCRADVRGALAGYDVAKLIGIVVASIPGLTQQRVADVIGYHPSSVSRVVNGHDRIVDIHRIGQITALLGIPPVYLGGGVQGIPSAPLPLRTFWDKPPAHTLEDMTRFVAADWSRRGVLAALPLATGAAFIDPLRGWAHAKQTTPLPVPAGVGMIEDEVMRIEQSILIFEEWDQRFGGGLGRRAVVGQLSEVLELLEQRHRPEITERLYGCAGALAHRAGFMAFDIEQQGLAQRYFTFGLRLSKEANDRALGAHCLDSLAAQMLQLDRSADALELLRLAEYGTRGAMSPGEETRLETLKARAYATLPEPDAKRCRRAIDMAGEAFAEVKTDNLPLQLRFMDRGDLAGRNGFALWKLAKRDPNHASAAAEFITEALGARTHTLERSSAFDLIGLTTARVLQGEPVEAARVGVEATELVRGLRSVRAVTRLREAAGLATERYPGVREVKVFADNVRALPRIT